MHPDALRAGIFSAALLLEMTGPSSPDQWRRLIDVGCFDYDGFLKAGPDNAFVAALVGNAAFADVLTALIAGRALDRDQARAPDRRHAAERQVASGESWRPAA